MQPVSSSKCPECQTSLVKPDQGGPWCPSCEWSLPEFDPRGRVPLGWRLLIKPAYRRAFAQDKALFEEFSARTHRTYGEPLSVLEPDDAAAVLDVLMAMLGGMLREWTRGAITADEAKQRLQAVVKLIFSGPPARHVLADTTTAAGG